jgi:hypothetical protein
MGVTARTTRDDMTHDTTLGRGESAMVTTDDAAAMVTTDDAAEEVALLRRMPRGEPTAGHHG